MFWVKATLYQYMRRKYGDVEAPKDVKLPGTPVTEAELYYPDASSLPDDEPIYRYEGGDSNLALGRTLKFILNPFARNNYYYEIEIPSREFMDYAVKFGIIAALCLGLSFLYYKIKWRFDLRGDL